MNKYLAEILKFAGTVKHFVTDSIWDVDFAHTRLLKHLWYSFCRVAALTVRGFIGDKCTLQASALTYITLVSLVPILAITLAFCKGIGLQKQLLTAIGIETIVTIQSGEDGNTQEVLNYRIIPAPEAPHAPAETEAPAPPEDAAMTPEAAAPADSEFPAAPAPKPGISAQLPEPLQEALINTFTYVDKTNFAALGFVGLVTLLCTVVMSIKKLENNFNAIWCVKQGRPIGRQFSEYLVMLLMLPIVLLAVLSLDTIFSADAIERVLHISSSPSLVFFTEILVKALMYLCMIGGFVFLMCFMPNTKVRFVPAVLSGGVTALAWGAVLYLYVFWQIGLAKFNAIYGTFAALPFFLAWLYAEWVVVLFGAELCYSLQNHRLLRFSKHLVPLTPGAAHLLGAVVMNEICNAFSKAAGPWNAAEFARTHAVPVTELNSVLTILKAHQLVIQCSPTEDGAAKYDFLPARPPETISLADVSEAFMEITSSDAARIGKCLPPYFLNFLDRHQKQAFANLKTVSFVNPQS